ncbi:MAG TPA: 50S ribosomal protein L10 [Porphyromonadaceae bacterium]|nr:50S ribosomal protein L10 [Porphyromonadaceae bacterium]
MKKEEKEAIIEKIVGALKSYPHFYLTDIDSLNAEATTELRRACFKNEIKLMVVKNALFVKALEKLEGDYSSLYPYAKGNTAIMFSEVGNAPAKLIKKYNQDGKEKPALKAAYVEEGFFLGANQLDALASMKSKNEVIAEIIMLLQSPAKNVISALQSGGQTICGVLKTLADR